MTGAFELGNRSTAVLPRGPAAEPRDALEQTLTACHPSLRSFLLNDAPPVLCFEGVTYSVKRRRCEDVSILQGITGGAQGGRMLAILGGSGAGKTSLLDVLTFRAQARGTVQGEVVLNGRRFTRRDFLSCAAYVAQEPLLWSALTARETLDYCAELHCLQMCAKQRALLVDEVLESMGLKSCEGTRAGDSLRKGLSGGQRKRLCIAEALIKRPSVLFLDEPTSALDSASAFEVAKLLRKMTKSTNVVVLCTVHQPSRRTFELFDDTLVLASGRVAFCGPSCEVMRHMTSLGVPPLPAGVSIAEYLMDVTNPDFTDASQVAMILDAWRPADGLPEKRGPDTVPCGPVRRSPLRQSAILTRRLALMTMRDPMLYSSRWLFASLSSTFFAFTYWKARERVQSQVLPRVMLFGWTTGATLFVTVMAVAVYSLEYQIFKKETSNGWYRPLAYVASQTLVALPCMLILACCALLPGFLLSGFKLAAAAEICLALATCYLWGECVAQLLAVCLPHYLFGMAVYILIMYVAFLLAGTIINLDDVFAMLRNIASMNPLLRCSRAIVTLDFAGSSFGGFGLDGELCGPPPSPCYAKDGESVLDAMHVLLSSFGSEHHAMEDVGVALLVAMCFKLAQTWYLTAGAAC